jgi:hypothetical protein
MVKSLRAILLSAGLLASSVAAQAICADVDGFGPNILKNPSWEEGLGTNWIYTTPIAEINKDEFTDGKQSL